MNTPPFSILDMAPATIEMARAQIKARAVPKDGCACLIWTRPRSKTVKQPNVWIPECGINVSARRALWELEKGKIPDTHHTLNTCGNEGCIAPSHTRLAVGTRFGPHERAEVIQASFGRMYQLQTKRDRINSVLFNTIVLDALKAKMGGQTYSHAPFDLIDGQGRFIEVKKAAVHGIAGSQTSRVSIIATLSAEQIKFANQKPLWLFAYTRDKSICVLLEGALLERLNHLNLRNAVRRGPYIRQRAGLTLNRLFVEKGEPFSLPPQLANAIPVSDPIQYVSAGTAV